MDTHSIAACSSVTYINDLMTYNADESPRHRVISDGVLLATAYNIVLCKIRSYNVVISQYQ